MTSSEQMVIRDVRPGWQKQRGTGLEEASETKHGDRTDTATASLTCKLSRETAENRGPPDSGAEPLCSHALHQSGGPLAGLRGGQARPNPESPPLLATQCSQLGSERGKKTKVVNQEPRT